MRVAFWPPLFLLGANQHCTHAHALIPPRHPLVLPWFSFNKSIQMQQKLVAKHHERQRAEVARAQAREQLRREEQEAGGCWQRWCWRGLC